MKLDVDTSDKSEDTRSGVATIYLLCALILLTGCAPSNGDLRVANPTQDSQQSPIPGEPSTKPTSRQPSETAVFPLSTSTPKRQITTATPTPLTKPGGQDPISTLRPTSFPQTPIKNCDPIPDYMFGIFGGPQIVDDQVWAICDGRLYQDEAAPVAGEVLWDYTARTGRIAYGTQQLSEGTSSDLWVYDYWNETSTQWITQNVLSAVWAPIFNDALGLQPIAAILGERAFYKHEMNTGTLVLITGPQEFRVLDEDVCCLAWSPLGDQIAYVKNKALYKILIAEGQPRKLAEGATGRPVWALEDAAIFFPGPNLRVAMLDGSENFIPKFPNGNHISGIHVTSMLWSGDHRTLIMRDDLTSSSCEYCGTYFSEFWMYKFPENLKRVSRYLFFHGTSDIEEIILWWKPGESVLTGNGDIIEFLPQEGDTNYSGEAYDFNPLNMTFTLSNQDQGDKSITVTSQTVITDLQGERIRFRDLEGIYFLEVEGEPVFNGNGILAHTILVHEQYYYFGAD